MTHDDGFELSLPFFRFKGKGPEGLIALGFCFGFLVFVVLSCPTLPWILSRLRRAGDDRVRYLVVIPGRSEAKGKGIHCRDA